MKKIILCLIMLLSISGLIFTAMSVAAMKGNPRKGRYLYRHNCLGCHAKKPKVKSDAKVLNPTSKTQNGWKKTFENGNYKNVKCVGRWENLSDSDINDIYLFLYEYASDSLVPMTCADN